MGWGVFYTASAARVRWLAACSFVWAGMAASAAPSGNAPPAPIAHRPALGLIVQFKDAPAHAARPKAPGRNEAPSPADAEHERVQRVLGKAGLHVKRLRPVMRSAQLLDFGRVLSATEAAALAEQLRQRPEVAWVEPNVRESALQVPFDPYFPATPSSTGQWWLFPVSGSDNLPITERRRGVPGLQSAWATHTGSAAAVVAVLDTGVTSHPDLDPHVLPGYDLVSDVEYANDGNGRDADASDPGDWVDEADLAAYPALFDSCELTGSTWHGTDIAGIIAGVSNNGIGVAGINWDGRVLPVRVAGKCGASVTDIVDGMRWAAGLSVSGLPVNPNPARVVNISFGGSGSCSPYQAAIDELRAMGVVVVAAAGNQSAGVSRPAKCPGVIGVAAMNRDGFKATYANFGPEVSVATVGGDPASMGAWGALGDDGLLALDNHGDTVPGPPGYSRLFGSSFSAPIVSGVVSLMLSVNPGLSAAQIAEGLRLSARPHVTSLAIGQCSAQNPGRCICTTVTCGAGLLDAAHALAYAGNPGAYVAPNWPAVEIDNRDVKAAAALGSDLPSNAAPPAAGGGGGALGFPWLLGLSLAVCALAGSRRRSS